MDWAALFLSIKLAAWTALILAPIGILLGRALAWRQFRGKLLVEAILALPLVLPPTVLGYYLLTAMGGQSPVAWLSQWLA
ncbi:MAG: molybdate ABC transporter permease subunit, partial [Casimicrobiaceae bacterium]